MDAAEYQLMYKVEDSHWWYQGMAAVMRSVLESRSVLGGNLSILDAGCGTGGTMSWLSDYGKVAGLDFSARALHYSRKRGHNRVVQASVTNLPFAPETFDLVVSLDVLYFAHVQDELALREFLRVLVPGGRILLRLPAYNWLRGAHDRQVSTAHRYTRKEVREKLLRNGMTPELLTYVNTFLFPAVAVKRMLDRFLSAPPSSDLAVEMKAMAGFLRGCLRLESRLIRWGTLPFGLSIVGLARKPIH
ncbi:MAG: class I SAM-dependent methyltransferase [Thermodesulfobacteriota bacterium]